MMKAAEPGIYPSTALILIALVMLVPLINGISYAIRVASFADLNTVMTGGGPTNSAQILSTCIVTTAFRKRDVGYASRIYLAVIGNGFLPGIRL